MLKYHVIWDVKLAENFRGKGILVANGHTNDTPLLITYSLVESRYYVRIVLTVAALDWLDLLACDVQNAYLSMEFGGNIFMISGP